MIESINSNIKQVESTLRHSSQDFANLSNKLIQDSIIRYKETIKTNHIKKLDSLTQEAKKDLQMQPKIKTLNKETSVNNLSSRILNPEELKILELGLNYAIPNKHLKSDLVESALSVENILIHSEGQEEIKESVRIAVATEIQKVSKNLQHSNRDPGIIKTLKNLRQDRSIVILKADKGNSTVIMNRNDYDFKIQTMLAEGPYTLLKSDPTEDVRKQVKEFCNCLLLQSTISDKTFKFLTNGNQRCPTVYGLPKIHKQNIPLRPIVDFWFSPTYRLASFLVPVLKTLTENHPYAVQNGFQFVDLIKTKLIRRTEQMVSFDGVSLFTKVPIQDTLLIIKRRLQFSQSWKESTELSEDQVMRAVELCVSNTNFFWRGHFYSQTEGSAMGSPISPIFCELFLQELELNIVKNNSNISFYVRYVDDIIAIVKSRFLPTILTSLNSFHKDVQFTVETELNDCLAFLDVQVLRKQDGKLGHKVYRKPTYTDKYLNFKSHHHYSQKISVIDSLAYRALKISDSDNVQIKNVLVYNDYPLKLIQQRIQVMTNRIQQNIIGLKNDGNWCAIPFVGAITYRISKILRNKLNINLGYYTGTKLSSFLNSHKDKCAAENTNCGIYSVNCSSCPKKYIGETKRDYVTRFNEHINNCRKNQVNLSAIALHLSENTGHFPDESSLILIEKESRFFYRKTKESLYIRKCCNTMNTNYGWKVNSIWTSTLTPLLKDV
jgi:hypothetical protein